MSVSPSVPGPELKLEAEKTPNETIVHCTGRITSDTAALFQETIRNLIPESKCITVDLSQVSYIDSAGLGALTGVWSSAKRKSAEVGFRWPEAHGSPPAHEIRLVNFNSHVRKLLQITKLDKIFGVPDKSSGKDT
jgi:anti-anti-sigma factor